jgi:hypothetical protein
MYVNCGSRSTEAALRLFNDIIIDDVFASNVMHHHAKGGLLVVSF